MVDKNTACILLFHNILLPLHHNTFLFSCLRPSSRDGGADFLSSRLIREGATASHLPPLSYHLCTHKSLNIYHLSTLYAIAAFMMIRATSEHWGRWHNESVGT